MGCAMSDSPAGDGEATKSTRWRDFWDRTFPVLLGAAIAIATAYFTTKFQTSAQADAQKAAEQLKVVASLRGEGIVWEQYNISHANAWTAAEFYKERWRRAGNSPNDSIDIEEAKYWMHSGTELVYDAAKSAQIVFEDLATIQALFPNTPKLRELCNRIYTFQMITTPNPPQNGSLDDWKDAVDKNVGTLAQSEYSKPIGDLVTYLLPQLSPQ
jgi:hypothetical protein